MFIPLPSLPDSLPVFIKKKYIREHRIILIFAQQRSLGRLIADTITEDTGCAGLHWSLFSSPHSHCRCPSDGGWWWEKVCKELLPETNQERFFNSFLALINYFPPPPPPSPCESTCPPVYLSRRGTHIIIITVRWPLCDNNKHNVRFSDIKLAVS